MMINKMLSLLMFSNFTMIMVVFIIHVNFFGGLLKFVQHSMNGEIVFERLNVRLQRGEF